MDSGLRKISVLAKLSRFRKISTLEIQSQLKAEGTEVSLRTIQRDLVELSQKFPIIADESKPIGWQMSKDAELTLPNFDLTTAIMFVLLEKHLSNMLPKPMFERLEPFVRTAKSFLSNESELAEVKWPTKITMIGKGLPLLSERINEQVMNTVYSAVLHEAAIELEYRALTKSEPSHYSFHPHGIILREERSYLVGRFEGYEDIRQIALSRILSAKETTNKAQIDKDFKLKRFIQQGKQNLRWSEGDITIELWITDVLAKLLKETPLSEQQTITPYKDDYLITAHVEDSDELRHWLLSMVNHATVITPESLRKEIKQTLEDALSYY